MSFNADLNKQTQKVIFSRKLNHLIQKSFLIVHQLSVLIKHLEMYLDKAINFNCQIKEKMSEAMKGIGLIQKLSKTFPRHSLLTIYKLFVRHLDYGDIIFNQRNTESFTHKN